MMFRWEMSTKSLTNRIEAFTLLLQFVDTVEGSTKRNDRLGFDYASSNLTGDLSRSRRVKFPYLSETYPTFRGRDRYAVLIVLRITLLEIAFTTIDTIRAGSVRSTLHILNATQWPRVRQPPQQIIYRTFLSSRENHPTSAREKCTLSSSNIFSHLDSRRK